MKNHIFLIAQLFSFFVCYGQNLDTKGRLCDSYYNYQLIIENDSTLFLRGKNCCYRAIDFKEGWRKVPCPPIKREDFIVEGKDSLTKDSYSFMHGHQSSVQKDSILISGNLKGKKWNAIYRTIDEGRTWDFIEIDSSYGWSYHTELRKGGKVWISDAGSRILYSSDFGKNWTKLPALVGTRFSICMISDSMGFAADGNSIHFTLNNWKSSKRIQTPFDQRKYAVKDSNYLQSVDNIFFLNNFLISNQENHFFYTKMDSIDWKIIQKNIWTVKADKSTGNLYLLSRNGELYRTNNLMKTERLLNDRRFYEMVHLQVINDKVYIQRTFGGILYKYFDNKLDSILPFSKDEIIEKPKKIYTLGKTNWSSVDCDLIVSKNDGNWYREFIFPKYIESIVPLDDNNAIINLNGKNVIYSLLTHSFSDFKYHNPLGDFIKYPIAEISFDEDYWDLWSGYNYRTFYSLTKDKFKVNNQKKVRFEDLRMGRQKTEKLKQEIDFNKVSKLLVDINDNYDIVPIKKDFEISLSSKLQFKRLIKREKQNIGNWRDELSYKSTLSFLDTASSKSIQKVIDYEPNRGISSSSLGSKVTLKNTKNDSVIIKCHQRDWQLPLTIFYSNKMYLCYNIKVARFLKEFTPDLYYSKKWFNNVDFLYKIGEYLVQSQDN